MIVRAGSEDGRQGREIRHPLERLLSPLSPVRLSEEDPRMPRQSVPTIYSRSGFGSRTWLANGSWRLFVRHCQIPWRGEEILGFSTANGGRISARFEPNEQAVFVPFDLGEAFTNYVSEAWRTGYEQRQLSTRQLDLFYRLKRSVPRRWQLAARRLLISRWQRVPKFPAWPFDESVATLLRFYARCQLLASGRTEASFRWFWPDGYHAALILTHDVESHEGLRLAIELADLEEERGFRSSFNIVAGWYEVDRGILKELRQRGFEVGVHGVYHDRSMFASRESFDSQSTELRQAVADLGAKGFRSPATHRVFEWLADLPVSYDCSIPHSDPFEPQPGGCCTIWPFFIGNVVELPYTMPQDHTLLTLLRHRSPELWLRQVARIEADNGLVQSVTHPDPGYLGDLRKRRTYSEFLDAVAGHDHLWKALPREVAAWWRARDAGATLDRRIKLGVMRADETSGEVTFEPSSTVKSMSENFAAG